MRLTILDSRLFFSERRIVMPREGKHDRFARELCEGLVPHFPGYSHQSGSGHWLSKPMPSGSQIIEVLLSGANAPYKQLEFCLGVRYDAYQAVVCRLGLQERYPDGSPHFWTTTFNCIKHFPPPPNIRANGAWSINLDTPGHVYIPDICPVLTPVSEAFFNRFSDIRVARDAALRHDGTLFTIGAWQQIIVADLALKNFDHLREFATKKSHGWGLERDDALWEKICIEFIEEVDLFSI
jgi:hypothetical protein